MHKITKDALTLFIFSAVAGIASYLYFFAMARMLTIEGYGLLSSLNSLMYILSIPQETIRTVISVFIAKFKARDEKGKMHSLFSAYLKRMFFFSGILFIVFLAISPLIAMLLHTTFSILLATSLSLIFAFALPVIWGVFQGLEKFKDMGINDSVFNVAKLVAAMVLVLMLPSNMKIYGALLSVPVSMALAFFLGFWYFRDIRKIKKQEVKEKTTRYSLATLLIFGLVTLMYSADVIIARYFLTPKMAGIYGGISTIGKALFFIATGIKRVMVPNLAGESEKGKKASMAILKKAGSLIAGLFGAAFVLSLFLSEWVVKIVLGSKYLIAAPYLKYMVIAMALFSFSNLLVYYNLVTNRNNRITFQVLLAAAFLQIALMIFFHQNIMQLIWVLMILYGVLLISMIIISLVPHKEHEPMEPLGSINIFNTEKKENKGIKKHSKKSVLKKERYKNQPLLKKK